MHSLRPCRRFPRLAALAAGLALLAFEPAAAGPADRDSALRWFDGVDTDRDGVIDSEEMTRVRSKRFGRYDGNGDGYVTLDEFNFAVPEELEDELERRRRRFAVMDGDGDERLTSKEYLDFGTRVIRAADVDGDGSITREEFTDTVAPE